MSDQRNVGCMQLQVQGDKVMRQNLFMCMPFSIDLNAINEIVHAMKSSSTYKHS